jgi:hypothetical protein
VLFFFFFFFTLSMDMLPFSGWFLVEILGWIFPCPCSDESESESESEPWGRYLEGHFLVHHVWWCLFSPQWIFSANPFCILLMFV